MKKILEVFVVCVCCVWSMPACSGGNVDAAVRIKALRLVEGRVHVDVVAKNTGDVTHEFPVGCSLQRKDGSWLDIPYELVVLNEGEERVVVFRSSRVDPGDFVLVRVAIWEKVKSDGLLETRYDMDERAFD